jgi:alkyldihydroxyacetonephosphate synthase
MLLVGASGEKGQARAALGMRCDLARRNGGVHAAAAWASAGSRTASATSTCATPRGRMAMRSTRWKRRWTGRAWTPAMRAVEAARRRAGADGEQVHAYTHLSHLYAQGASVYTTFIWRLSGDYESDLARWRRSRCASHGGDRRKWRHHQPPARRRHRPRALAGAEKGALGMAAMRALFAPLRSGRLHESREAGAHERPGGAAGARRARADGASGTCW